MIKAKILVVFGTRPEAIKMCPLVRELYKKKDQIETIVAVTSQHKEMLYPVLELFDVKPDFDLNIMKKEQDLWHITTAVLNETKSVFEKCQPNMVLVHGDTTTTLATSLSAFYYKIPIGHVEAGLRTFNKYYPFPEEINRVVADAVSTLYFAPTERSQNNLINAGVDPSQVYLTGNTVIDGLLYVIKNRKCNLDALGLDKNKKIILLTAHRRENFGIRFENIFTAIRKIAESNSDIQIVYPVHLNPNVQEPAKRILSGQDNIHLLKPLDYAPFSALMNESHIILTDSGGIQEEAPSLGKPVLVLREETERPEAVEYGTVKLVGSNIEAITNTVQKLLDSEQEYNKMASSTNPYGDGKACERIVQVLMQYFS